MPKRNDVHHKIQVGIVDWYDLVHGDELLIAIPNGDARDRKTVIRNGKQITFSPAGKRLKKEGARAGVFDLFLAKPDWNGPVFHGLWVEVKRPDQRNHKNGGLSPEQVKFRDRAQMKGYRCEVVYTTQDGIDVISRYLN